MSLDAVGIGAALAAALAFLGWLKLALHRAVQRANLERKMANLKAAAAAAEKRDEIAALPDADLHGRAARWVRDGGDG